MKSLSRPLVLIGLTVLAIAVLGTFLVSGQFYQVHGLNLQPDKPQVVSRGRQLYNEHCASCHGINLEGQPNWRTFLENGRLPAPPHDETGHTWHHADGILFDIVKRGTAAVVGGNYQSDMPGYGESLVDDDIVAILSYIKSRWPKEVRDRHDLINRNSQR